jgi:hypothetical protein
MAEVTALGFEYANRTGNTLDGLTATREKLAMALSQNNELETMLNNVIWASGSVVVRGVSFRRSTQCHPWVWSLRCPCPGLARDSVSGEVF